MAKTIPAQNIAIIPAPVLFKQPNKQLASLVELWHKIRKAAYLDKDGSKW
jgi:hypothetical protein